MTADYLHYGFWLKKTADADGAVTYNEVETFAGATVGGMTEGSDGTANSMLSRAARPTNGGATGVYVHSEVNSDGSSVATTAGQFAADAELTAIFGQLDAVGCVGGEAITCGTIAPNLLNTVTGTISNFALEHGEANTWAVNLKGGTRAAGANTFTSVDGATGGGAPGDWSGTFHGALDADDPTVMPSSVVGEFNANFSNGSAVGGFGARKK